MGNFDTTYEKKSKKVIVECANVFDGLRKGSKDVLLLNPLQAYVEVSLEAEISDEKSMKKAVDSAVDPLRDKIRKEVEDLVESLHKLQKEEGQGNKKAATEAEKLVKNAEKSVKKWAETFGTHVRKAVQAEFLDQTKIKEQLRSASRTNFRGMELSDDAFDEAPEGSASPAGAADLAKSLASIGKELCKLSDHEEKIRNDLGTEIQRVQQVVEKARAGKTNFDSGEYFKTNAKEVRELEVLAGKYGDALSEFFDELDKAEDQTEKLTKLIAKNEKLSDDKELKKAISEYESARKSIDGSVPSSKDAAALVQRLFKEDYKDGSGWKKISAELAGFKGADKSVKTMQDAGGKLEKALKE